MDPEIALKITKMLDPKSIAVIGASRNPEKIGYQVVKNLLNAGYEGKIYPVNPNADEILGLKAYPSVLDIPDDIDLAVIVVPAKIVPNVIEDCGKKGVNGLVIITSGFSEIGEEGKELEEKVVEIAKRYGMRIIGPNVVGICNTKHKVNASFAMGMPYEGEIALVSQSGALGVALIGRTWIDRVGLSKFISIGNMADLNFSDFVEYFKDDHETKVIALYIEGVKDGRRFLEVSAESSKVKPIIALKAGLSKRGASAAMSHTGSLAGSAEVYKAAFKQSGVIMAEDLTDLFVKANALALCPRMKGDNWVIITNGGGVGVLSTDAGEKYGIPLPDIPEELKNEFRKCMPEFGSPKNPVDLTGMATEKEYKEALKIALKSDFVDGIIVLYCHTAHTDPMEIAKAIKEAIDEEGGMKKPVIVSFIGGKEVYDAIDWLKENKIPAYDAPEMAVKALATIRHYTKWSERPLIKPKPPEGIDREKARKIIEKALSEGREWLFEDEAKELLASYGIRVTKMRIAKTEDEAAQYAREIGFPVVLKIVSPDVVHKSDVGGVKVDIKSEDEVRRAYNEILENVKRHVPNARIEGILVQEMAPWGTEVIIGSTRDPQFGPTVMFGLGGIFVEILKDVTFRVAPIEKEQAKEMIEEIKGYPIIAGARGRKPLDKETLADAISRVSWLVHENPEIIELDANPVFLYEKGLIVADARVRLRRS